MNRKLFYGVFTPFCIIAISLMVKGTVYGMEKGIGSDSMEKYYESLEKEYLSSVEDILDESGYETAGVMLNKIIYPEGNREYTLSIHYRRNIDADTVNRIEKEPLAIENSVISIMTTK